MTESSTVLGIVWSVDPVAGTAQVVVDGKFTTVYPQDGALPEAGQEAMFVRNGGDLIPISASSQRMSGTFRGEIEAESFIGTSVTVVDVWDDPWVWSPTTANTTVSQPTEGVDPALMRLTRTGSTGRARATITIPAPSAKKFIAMELSAPAASSTGRDCYAELKYMLNGSTLITYTIHLDNLYADARAVQSAPLFPPAFTTHIKIDVYSESTTMTAGQFLDLRLRAWTVPVFQGGALLDLDGDVLMDHRGIILNGFPVLEEPRVIPMAHGTNIWDFPLTFSTSSEYSYKPLGSLCQINLSFEATSGSAASTQARFKLPYVSRKHALFTATYLDQTTRWFGGFAHVSPGSDICNLHHNEAGNNGNVDESNPFVFANTDLIVVSGLYPIVA